MEQLNIHAESCRGCRMCIDICPTDVLLFDKSAHKAQVGNKDDCIDCLSCTYICPSGAITQEGYHSVKNFYRDASFSNKIARFL